MRAVTEKRIELGEKTNSQSKAIKANSEDCLLSIIVVTWNNENNIEQALNSCIFSDSINYEVIVVHNASDDETGELIRRVADSNPGIFRIIENESNIGLGPARNIGITSANGKYLAFLDGDDWYATEFLSTIGEHISADQFDVLVFNHARVWDDGGTIKNSKTYLLNKYDNSDVSGKLRILGNFNVAWNKIYRRDFILSIGAKFSPGFYEDVSWHFKTLIGAQVYRAIPDVLIKYRQRGGSILRSRDARHIDLIERYMEVYDYIKSDPVIMKNYGVKIYHHAQQHMLGMILAYNRLPSSSEKEYLTRMRTLLVSWREEAGVKFRSKALIVAESTSPIALKSAYRAHSASKLISGKFEGVAKTLLRLIPDKLKSGIYRAANLIKLKFNKITHAASQKKFAISRILPVRGNQVLVESYWGKKVDCNPYAIACGLLNKRSYEIYYAVNDVAAAQAQHGNKFKFIKKGSLKYAVIAATSKFLVNNVNFPDQIIKRRQQVYVQTKHGTPLKFMGLDIRSKRPREMNWKAFAKRCRQWDYVISSNSYSSTIWRHGFPYGYKILETGYPRNDRLINATPEEIEGIKAKLGIPLGKKIALYAPTFRDEKGGRAFFDTNAVIDALGDDYYLLVRGHYFENTRFNLSQRVVDVSSVESSTDIMLISDILITDYSSIMFDYACLSRPIILYQYDAAKYAKSRGMYMSIDDYRPGSVVYSFEYLISCLSSKSFEGPESMALLESFRSKYCKLCDGSATDRVVESVFNTADTEWKSYKGEV